MPRVRTLLTVLALVLGACADARTPGTPAPDTLHAIHIGTVPARVRIASTPDERRRGLMHVDALAPDEGMLFVYPVADQRSIWMENCRIALDVAFADADGRILEITTLAPPTQTGGDVAQVLSEDAAVYVLEMPAGFFARHGIGPGHTLRMGQAAGAIVRGVRSGTDYDYEAQMAATNQVLLPRIETLLLATSPALAHITSTLVRQVASMGGDASALVPGPVAAALRERFSS